jgi:hypothetical protein
MPDVAPPDPPIPPVPPSREAWGPEWHALWERAHREMAVWDRVPSRHLIDELLQQRDRGYLHDWFAEIAGTTHMLGGMADTTYPDRRIWSRFLPVPATMGPARIRVVLDGDGRTIITAFPI